MPKELCLQGRRASLSLAEALRRILSLSRQFLPQNKAPMPGQWVRTEPGPSIDTFPGKGVGLCMSWSCPHCSTVPVPKPRDCTPSPNPVLNPDTTLSPALGGGMLCACPCGPSLLQSGCCGAGRTPTLQPLQSLQSKSFPEAE